MADLTTTLATSQIVSLAFLAMEKTPPASFADDSEEAAQSLRFYPLALDRTLESGDWSFASTYADLPPLDLPHGAARDPALPFVFSLPGDALALREVGDGEVRLRWRVDKIGDTRALRADCAGPIQIRYTARLANETLLPASFKEAVALQLAVYLAQRFLGTANKIELLKRDLSEAIKMALREDSRTASAARYDGLDISHSDDWVTEARR